MYKLGGGNRSSDTIIEYEVGYDNMTNEEKWRHRKYQGKIIVGNVLDFLKQAKKINIELKNARNLKKKYFDEKYLDEEIKKIEGLSILISEMKSKLQGNANIYQYSNVKFLPVKFYEVYEILDEVYKKFIEKFNANDVSYLLFAEKLKIIKSEEISEKVKIRLSEVRGNNDLICKEIAEIKKLSESPDFVLLNNISELEEKILKIKEYIDEMLIIFRSIEELVSGETGIHKI